MGNEIANIQISQDVIEPIVRAQLQASITAAMGKSDELIAQVVHTVMNLKVDKDGKKSDYHYAQPLITWMAESAIKEAAKDSLKEWFAENRAVLKKQIDAAIKRNLKGITESFVLGLVNMTTDPYKLDIAVNVQKKTY